MAWYWVVIIVFIAFSAGILLAKNWEDGNSTTNSAFNTVPDTVPDTATKVFKASKPPDLRTSLRQQQELAVKIKKESERLRTWLYGQEIKDEGGA
jgi:hypothetical protein